jgi:hypothetical protein
VCPSQWVERWCAPDRDAVSRADWQGRELAAQSSVVKRFVDAEPVCCVCKVIMLSVRIMMSSASSQSASTASQPACTDPSPRAPIGSPPCRARPTRSRICCRGAAPRPKRCPLQTRRWSRYGSAEARACPRRSQSEAPRWLSLGGKGVVGCRGMRDSGPKRRGDKRRFRRGVGGW